MPHRHQTNASLCAALLLTAIGLPGSGAEPSGGRPPAPSLSTPASAALPADRDGFLRRWLVLEPVSVSGRLTMQDVAQALEQWSLPGTPPALPRAGQSVTLREQNLKWHALDTRNHNFNLYHFAWALEKPTSNVLFWITTVVDSPREMRDVRLAICSNAASVWWFNDERVIGLYNDRQSVIDDGVSRRVTLREGRNVIRAAIINGGGATDFCARFLDAADQPIEGLVVRLDRS